MPTAWNTPPFIYPNQSDVIALPSDNRTFICESTEPITWKYHKNGTYAKESSRRLVTESPNFNPTISHSCDSEDHCKSVIYLRNIDYTFNGHYYCVKNSSKELEMYQMLQVKNASRIYLFVKGIVSDE